MNCPFGFVGAIILGILTLISYAMIGMDIGTIVAGAAAVGLFIHSFTPHEYVD